MGKIFKFLLYLLPWFISSIIFKIDTYFYDSLNKPFFAPPSTFFKVIWPILYLTVAISLYKNFGFETLGVRKKYYNGIDGFIMEKKIAK